MLKNNFQIFIQKNNNSKHWKIRKMKIPKSEYKNIIINSIKKQNNFIDF